MIKDCPKCKVKYNNETIEDCPICIFHREVRGTVNFNREVSTRKHMVSNSIKGKPRKTPSGTSIKYVNQKSYYIPKKKR